VTTFTGYCSPGDLLTGSVPLPTYLDPAKFVSDAADEIDSKIGFIYVTPVDVSDGSTAVRPVRLLLKRLNVFLATGRLLMTVDAGGEDKTVHAYGLRLVTEAENSLAMIASGQLPLDGAARVDDGTGAQPLGPIIGNKDAESYVDAFYDRIANPNYLFAEQYTYPHFGADPTGLVSK
jgi:hypothetical protein